MRLFPGRRAKVLRYILEKKSGQGFEQVGVYDRASWTNPPDQVSLSEELDSDVAYYRLIAEKDGGERDILWSKPPGKRRPNADGDVGAILDRALGPATIAAQKLSEFHAVMADAFTPRYDHDSTEGAPSPPVDPIEQRLAEIRQLNALYNEIALLKGDKSLADVAPLQFTGSAPWYLHPTAGKSLDQTVRNVGESLEHVAHDLGAKFREGFSNPTPPNSQAPQPRGAPQPPPFADEPPDPKMTELAERLRRRAEEMKERSEA